MGDGRGISQAEAMRRRVSPEGRRLAALEQTRRRRATWRVVGRVLLCALLVVLAAGAWSRLAGPLTPIDLAAALVALLALAFVSLRRRSASPAIATASLPALPARTTAWLAEQRVLLPAPAVTLVDAIGARIEALSAQLTQLDPATPAADDLRKLLGRELPGLVDQYHAVPATMRGGEVDAQLLHSLGVVDRQLDALTRQIASGAVDGLATQDRYLESKYSGGV